MIEWAISKAGLATVAIGAAGASIVLATADNFGALEKFLSTFGVLAALVWFMWHNQTRVIPSLNKTHREDILKLCKENTESTERICQRFTDAQKVVEQEHTQQLKQIGGE